MLAVVRSVEGADRGHGVERMTEVGRGRGVMSGSELLVSDGTEAVGVLGLTVAFASNWDAFEKTGSIKSEEVLLGDAERSVYKLG
jgi:hypothetical protein